jgi:hypothetical protein
MIYGLKRLSLVAWKFENTRGPQAEQLGFADKAKLILF